MNSVIEWLIKNKEWVFSGVGVVIIGIIVSFLLKRKPDKQSTQKSIYEGIHHTSQGAAAYQAGRDIKINHGKAFSEKKASLRLVAVEVVDDIRAIFEYRETWLRPAAGDDESKGVFPVIDIKLLNCGEGTAYLSRLVFDVEIKRTSPDNNRYSAHPANWEYTVLLDPHARRDKKHIALSQVVPANDADRFVVIVGHDMNYGEFEYADYEISLCVEYNGTENLDLGRHSLRVHAPVNLSKHRNIGVVKLSAT